MLFEKLQFIKKNQDRGDVTLVTPKNHSVIQNHLSTNMYFYHGYTYLKTDKHSNLLKNTGIVSTTDPSQWKSKFTTDGISKTVKIQLYYGVCRHLLVVFGTVRE